MTMMQQDTSRRYGALLLIAAVLQFVASMAIVQLAFQCHGGQCYNLLTNPISDLGSAGLNGHPYSPLWPLFNYSIAVFGVLGIAGLIMLRGWFPKNAWRVSGLAIIIVSLFASIGVGIVPEDTILALHSLFALIAFFGSAFGLLLLSIGLYKGRRRYAAFSTICGLTSLAVLFVFVLPDFGILARWAASGPGFGFGGMERLLAAPVLLWLVVTGLIAIRKR